MQIFKVIILVKWMKNTGACTQSDRERELEKYRARISFQRYHKIFRYSHFKLCHGILFRYVYFIIFLMLLTATSCCSCCYCFRSYCWIFKNSTKFRYFIVKCWFIVDGINHEIVLKTQHNCYIYVCLHSTIHLSWRMGGRFLS